MSPDSIPQISLGGAALIIFVVCAAYVLLRGMTRMLIGTLVLAASAWLGFLVWQKAPALSLEWTGKITTVITFGLPLITFVAAFFLLRTILKLIVRPFGRGDDKENSPSIISRVIRLPLALFPAALLWLIGATIVHHAGSIAEIRSSAEQADGSEESIFAGYTRRLKDSVGAALPESLLTLLDPLADPSRVNLAKLIAAQTDQPLKPVIDPTTGQAIPRAIIVDDPELQNLAREGDFGTLLRHPLLTKALEDPQVQAHLKNLHR